MYGPSGFQVIGTAPDAYAQYNPVIMAPFVEAVIAAAGVRSRMRVLDVACGTGLATRRAAEVVGAAGHVAGLDLNAGMLVKARSTESAVSDWITWHEGSALDLPFADGEFDAVICQQGIEFFPDLTRAASEMARVLAPGGRAAVTFWAPLVDQTYMAAQIVGLREVLGEAVTPVAGAFDLAPEAVVTAFAAAGMIDTRSEKVVASVVLPPLEEFAVGQVGALPVAPAFAALPVTHRDAYLAGMQAALASCRTEAGTYEVTFASWLVTGARGLPNQH